MYGTPLRFSISSAIRYSSALAGVVSSGGAVSIMADGRGQKSSRFDNGLVVRRRGRLTGRRRRLDQRNLDDEIRRAIGIRTREQRHGDVVDRNAGRRAAFRRTAVRVA